MPQLPSIPDTHPSSAILDSYRIAIAKRLSESLSLTLEQAFSGVDYGKKGEDFTVALPRFRLPGKVGEIAKQVIDKVSLLLVLGQTRRTILPCFAIQFIYTFIYYIVAEGSILVRT